MNIGTFLGIGEAGAGLSNAVQQYRENAARYREQKQREEMTDQQIKLTEAENEEAQNRLKAEKIAALQNQVKLQRDQQLRSVLPKYLQAAAPEDKPIISAAVDLGDVDPESALGLITKYYGMKATAGLKQAQAVATAEIQAKKEQFIQDQENQRAEATRKATDKRAAATQKAENARSAASSAAAMQRAVYTQGKETARDAAKTATAKKTEKNTMTQQERNSLTGLDVLNGALDKLSNLTSVNDRNLYERLKVARVLSMEADPGLVGSTEITLAAERLSQSEQDYVNAFNQARDSIQALRTFSGNPRSNMVLYNSFISLLPDPLRTTNSAMAKAKIKQLKEQIEIVKKKLGAQMGASAQGPGSQDFQELLNGAK